MNLNRCHPEQSEGFEIVILSVSEGSQKSMYYVYIATNKINTVLYTDITNNLIARMFQHKKKLVEGFTKKYNVNKLVYYEIFPSPIEAIQAEKKIKGWLRKKKLDLIKEKNPKFYDLTEQL